MRTDVLQAQQKKLVTSLETSRGTGLQVPLHTENDYDINIEFKNTN